MLRDVRPLAVTNGKRSRGDLLPGTHPDDDVLLSDYGTVPRTLAFAPTKELKWFDNSRENANIPRPGGFSGTSLILNPDVGLIASPERGDGFQQRRGRRILLKNLQVRGFMRKPHEGVALQPPAPVVVYIGVIADTQTNGAQCTSTQIFSSSNDSGSFLYPPFRNMEWNDRFQVLKHEIFYLGRASAFTIDSTAVPPEFSWAGDILTFEWFVPLNYVVNFNSGTSNAITSVNDVSLHLVASQSADHQCGISYTTRVRFADLSE